MGFFTAFGNIMFGLIMFISILIGLNIRMVVSILMLNFTYDNLVLCGVALVLDLIVYLFYKLK